jgi:predicted metal-dependent hydrolase
MKTSIENMIGIYNDIQYVDPNENYDLYCDNNKINEKRRSVTQFYVNLSKNGLVPKENIAKVLVELLKKILRKIEEPNNKNEVDELVENIVILYNKDILDNINEDDDELMINDENMTDIIEHIANSNIKNYKSLTSKTIFKFMDLIDT